MNEDVLSSSICQSLNLQLQLQAYDLYHSCRSLASWRCSVWQSSIALRHVHHRVAQCPREMLATAGGREAWTQQRVVEPGKLNVSMHPSTHTAMHHELRLRQCSASKLHSPLRMWSESTFSSREHRKKRESLLIGCEEYPYHRLNGVCRDRCIACEYVLEQQGYASRSDRKYYRRKL